MPAGKPQACPASLLGPVVLMADPDLVPPVWVVGPQGERTDILWRSGVVARDRPGEPSVELILDGRIVAVAGQVVWLGGGFGVDGRFFACEVLLRPPGG